MEWSGTTAHQIASCTKIGSILNCPRLNILQKASEESCLYCLFFKSHRHHTVCATEVSKKSTHIREIADGSFLLTNVKKITITKNYLYQNVIEDLEPGTHSISFNDTLKSVSLTDFVISNGNSFSVEANILAQNLTLSRDLFQKGVPDHWNLTSKL